METGIKSRPVYREIASLIQAIGNCQRSWNKEWEEKHGERLRHLVELLPSGSGFDNGTKLDTIASNAEKLVFTTAFHHMNENGYYDGWTEHTVYVTPSFDGI